MKKDLYTTLPKPSLVSVLNSIYPNKQILNRKVLKIVIFGYFGVNNIGDDAILLAELNELNKLNIKIKVTVPSQNPDNITKFFKVESISNRDFFALVRSVLDSDIIIFGGGGLICKIKDNSSLTQKILDNIFTIYKSIVFFLIPKLFLKKVIVFGIGAYPNISIFQKLIYLNVLNLSDFISVRDEISYHFLTSQLSKRVKYEKDVAFLLNDDDLTLKNKRYFDSFLNFSQKKYNVGISLLTTNDEQKDEVLITQLSKIINSFSDKCNFYFFPFYVEPLITNDETMFNKLVMSLNKPSLLKIIPYSLGPGGFHYLFTQLNFSVSMRFHAQVFSYKAHIPFVGVSYDKKCESFMDQIGASYIKMDDLNEENFYQLLYSNLLMLDEN